MLVLLLHGTQNCCTLLTFLKWQPSHFPVMAICFVYVNLHAVLLMSFNKLASCPLPNINLQFFFIVDYTMQKSWKYYSFTLLQNLFVLSFSSIHVYLFLQHAVLFWFTWMTSCVQLQKLISRTCRTGIIVGGWLKKNKFSY